MAICSFSICHKKKTGWRIIFIDTPPQSCLEIFAFLRSTPPSKWTIPGSVLFHVASGPGNLSSKMNFASKTVRIRSYLCLGWSFARCDETVQACAASLACVKNAVVVWQNNNDHALSLEFLWNRRSSVLLSCFALGGGLFDKARGQGLGKQGTR